MDKEAREKITAIIRDARYKTSWTLKTSYEFADQILSLLKELGYIKLEKDQIVVPKPIHLADLMGVDTSKDLFPFEFEG